MRLIFTVLGFFFLQTIMTGCDKTSNVEDPNKSHFVKFFGGDGDQTGQDMVVLQDGSFVLFGTTRPSGIDKTSNWYLVKSDTQGNMLWEKSFGGSNDEEASDIELTTNNTLVLVGNTYRSPTDRDIKIMTFTLDGDSINTALAPFPNNSDEDAISVSQTLDGFIVAGSTSNTSLKPNQVNNDQRDAVNLRFYTDLKEYDTSWGVTNGPGTYDVAVKVIQISPALYYVFGYSNTLVDLTHPTTDFNFFVFGLGSTGVANNSNLFAGDPINDEKMSSVSVTPLQSGDGYFLCGISYSNQASASGAADLYVAKIRKTLSFNATDLQFQKPLSINLGIGISEKTSVLASQQSGFYILTDENNFNDNQNWLLTKLNSDGSSAWTLPIVFGGEGLDTCGSIHELPDGKILLIGTMRTGKPDVGEFKMTLIKVNSDGKLAN